MCAPLSVDPGVGSGSGPRDRCEPGALGLVPTVVVLSALVILAGALAAVVAARGLGLALLQVQSAVRLHGS